MASSRRNLLVDHDVQGALLRRTALYGSCGALYFTVILLCGEAMSDPEQSLHDCILRCVDEMIYWLPGFAILTPVIAYDILRLTNRFAGPIFRLRRQMLQLADGKDANPIVFREDDHWSEMAQLFNAIREEMIELRRAQTSAGKAGSPQAPSTNARLFDEADEPSPLPLGESGENESSFAENR